MLEEQMDPYMLVQRTQHLLAKLHPDLCTNIATYYTILT